MGVVRDKLDAMIGNVDLPFLFVLEQAPRQRLLSVRIFYRAGNDLHFTLRLALGSRPSHRSHKQKRAGRIYCLSEQTCTWAPNSTARRWQLVSIYCIGPIIPSRFPSLDGFPGRPLSGVILVRYSFHGLKPYTSRASVAILWFLAIWTSLHSSWSEVAINQKGKLLRRVSATSPSRGFATWASGRLLRARGCNVQGTPPLHRVSQGYSTKFTLNDRYR